MFSKFGKRWGGGAARTCLCTHKHRYKICLTYFCFLSFCLSLSSWQARKRRVLLINDEGPELSHQVHIYSEVCMEARQCLGWHSNIPQLSMYFHLSRWMFLNSLDFFFLRHDTVQSSPLSSEQIHSKQSAGEKYKEIPSLGGTELCLWHQYKGCVWWALYQNISHCVSDLGAW